jgi:hypothetical protein
MLKPTELRLTGELSYSTYKAKLLSAVKTLPNKSVRDVVLSIFSQENNSKVDISKLNSTQINDIKNYLGESAGPYFLEKYNLNGQLTSNDKVFFPTSQTETLYDFSVKINSNTSLYSVKQLRGATNVLKPGDVVKIVSNNTILKNKWEDHPTFEVFKILNSNNVISGPISVIRDLYPKKTKLSKTSLDSVIAQMTKNDVVINDPPAALISMINSDEATKQNLLINGFVSGTAVNFLFEKILINISKQDDTFHELFLDVTIGNVKFLKFGLTNSGVFSVVVNDPKKAAKKAVLRSKQGVERRSSKGSLKLDKLGFQP